MGNSTQCKIVTPENLNTKLGICNYVADITHHTNFGWIRFSGGFSANGWNMTLLCLLFLYCPVLTFFSFQCPGRNAGLIFMHYGSNYVFLRKDGSFGGYDDEWCHLGGNTPQKLPSKMGTNRQFQAKTPKFINRNISESVSLINMQFCILV